LLSKTICQHQPKAKSRLKKKKTGTVGKKLEPQRHYVTTLNRSTQYARNKFVGIIRPSELVLVFTYTFTHILGDLVKLNYAMLMLRLTILENALNH